MSGFQPAFATYHEWIGRDSGTIPDHFKTNAKTAIEAQGGNADAITMSVHGHKLPVPEDATYKEAGDGLKIRTDDNPVADYLAFASAPVTWLGLRISLS